MGKDKSPKKTSQNVVQQQTANFDAAQKPIVENAQYNLGRSSETNYNDYNDMMDRYRAIESGIAGGGGAAGGGGGGGGAFGITARTMNYNDPFASYKGYQDFSNTGGYSAQDMANLRARGTSPVRAAYANAEREMGRQRSLQGGYSPNAFAAQTRMAREQSQGMADAMQNVEGGIVQNRNQNRLAGLGGMSDIEKQRLAADMEIQQYNNNALMAADQSASNASASNAAAQAAYNQNNIDNQFQALSGMRATYGTTPGLTAMFGDQAQNAANATGNFGIGAMNATIGGQKLPGQYEQNMDRFQQGANLAGQVGNVLSDYQRKRQQAPLQSRQTVQNTGIMPTGGGGGLDY